jgi:hypothetical protein
MGPSRQQIVLEACRFRPEWANLLAEEQLAMVRNCVEVLGPTLRLEAAERQVLAEWIKAE